MGTKPNALKPFTFQDSGVHVLIRKVSPLLFMEVQRALPEPEPPMQEVDYGDGTKRLEPNPANPDYLRAKKKYEQDYELMTRKLIINRGVEVELGDDEKAEVQSIRDLYLEMTGQALSGSDKWVYIQHVAIGSPEDLQDLIKAITTRSQPTPEAEQDAEKSFPGNVPGPTAE